MSILYTNLSKCSSGRKGTVKLAEEPRKEYFCIRVGVGVIPLALCIVVISSLRLGLSRIIDNFIIIYVSTGKTGGSAALG